MKKQLYTNGAVVTMETEGDLHEALAVEGDKILGVGGMDEMKDMLGKGYAEVDLGGGALLPGFIDCHLHVILSAYFKMNLDLAKIRSLDEFLKTVKGEVEAAEKGKWIMGLRFREDDYPEKRPPTLMELDSVSPENPLVLLRYDGHSAIVNSLALKEANITADTPNPQGGLIEKAGGRPTGVLKELAMKLIMSAVPTPEIEEFKRGHKMFTDLILSYGITGVNGIMQTGEEGPSGALGPFEIPIFKLFEGDFPIRNYPMIAAPDVPTFTKALADNFGGKKTGGRWRGGALKLFLDGTFGSRTAYFTKDYHDSPGERGMLVQSIEEIKETIFAAQREGVQVATHAIGDRAVSELAKIYRDAHKEVEIGGGKTTLRHRIEHAGMINPEDYGAIKEGGAICSFQPSFIASEGSWIESRVGGRLNRVYPIRSILDYGIPVCGGSDSPIEDPSVLTGIWAAVVREGFTADQSLSPFEAVSLYTRMAAYASFVEDARGTISKGKLADFVLLDKNPMDVRPNEIRDIEVKMTIIGGETVRGG
ncbi:MAG: amidohydrolase [Deltaproteobacteria bacterium]|uniref:Amidohydrolase n=1 Tax=Candidatus Zymogenus saltonus TaxID=2844893 RepID=A0A9D8KHU9_9DELT|nr:amidohydrolase [Candidatus Zymogenus saltonus]